MQINNTLVLLSICAALVACGGGSDESNTRPSRIGLLTMNDTGVSLCGDYAYGASAIHHNNVNCSNAGATQVTDGVDANGDLVKAGQDAVFGRDARYASNSDGDLGFNFTKLDRNGLALAIQNGTYSNSGVEASGTSWSCVQDNVTGLVWEVKTDFFTANMRDKDWTYLWYSEDATNNGGVAGAQDSSIGMGSNNCYSDTRCDVKKYVADINNSYLCGANTWRLPTKEELKTLRHLGKSKEKIDMQYFPHLFTGYYWTSSTQAADPKNAWVVDFADGVDKSADKTLSYAVMLVRNK